MDKSKKKADNILIPLYTGIGNAVLLTPFIHALKTQNPTCHITLIGPPHTGFQDLFTHDPHVDAIIYALDNRPYTVYYHTILGGSKSLACRLKLKHPRCKIMMQTYKGSAMSWKETLYSWVMATHTVTIDPTHHETLQYLTYLATPEHPLSDVPNIQLCPAAPSIPIALPSQYSIVQIGAAFNIPDSKRWSLENWATLIPRLLAHVPVVIVGSKNEADIAQDLMDMIPSHKGLINAVGQTTLGETISVIRGAQFIVGVDSGIGHIAGALQKKTLILWGPTDFKKSRQLGQHTHFIHLNKPCSPCRGPERQGLYNGPDSIKHCPHQLACMSDITPDHVMSTLESLQWTLAT